MEHWELNLHNCKFIDKNFTGSVHLEAIRKKKLVEVKQKKEKKV
jgi:hypothetical protein